MYKTILEKLIAKKHLTAMETESLLSTIIEGEMTNAQIAGFLVSLRMKGETTEELVGFVRALRKEMIRVNTKGMIIDVCGTGGDGLGTFNISTAVSFVVAGAGVKVAKHGNRKASSFSGSADVLEAMGISIDYSPEHAEYLLKKTGMTFLYAPLYHKATKQVVQVRKELQIRTMFNFLGPLVNPTALKRQLIGVPTITIGRQIAEVASCFNYDYLLIVSGRDGLDEISTTSITDCLEVKGNKIREFTTDPKQIGIKRSKLSDLVGGDPSINAAIILDILSGNTGPKTDIVLINTAGALMVSGKVETLEEGYTLAKQSIISGSAMKVYKNLKKESGI